MSRAYLEAQRREVGAMPTETRDGRFRNKEAWGRGDGELRFLLCESCDWRSDPTYNLRRTVQ